MDGSGFAAPYFSEHNSYLRHPVVTGAVRRVFYARPKTRRHKVLWATVVGFFLLYILTLRNPLDRVDSQNVRCNPFLDPHIVVLPYGYGH